MPAAASSTVAAFAAWLGFSLAVGALFAGLVFSRDPRAVRVEASFEPVHDLLAPFFFVAIGSHLDLGENVTATIEGDGHHPLGREVPQPVHVDLRHHGGRRNLLRVEGAVGSCQPLQSEEALALLAAVDHEGDLGGAEVAPSAGSVVKRARQLVVAEQQGQRLELRAHAPTCWRSTRPANVSSSRRRAGSAS